MKNTYLSGVIVAASITLGSAASADIFSDCAEAIERDDIAAVRDMALDIQQMAYISLRRQAAADICVSVGIGDVPLAEAESMQAERAAQQEAERLAAEKEAEAQREEARVEAEQEAEAVRQRICELQEVFTETYQTIQLAEQAKQDCVIETLGATVEACNSLFATDPTDALTNDTCNSIFTSGGLPNTKISGPSASETLLAELRQQNIIAELEILIETGMTLETLAARSAELETDNRANEFGCDINDG